jgi:hypothetical protein
MISFMVNKSLYFKDKNFNPELKTICSNLLFKENLSIKFILESSKYYCITTTNTITIIPLFNCLNIISSNPKDKQNEEHNAIFCEYKEDTIVYFNYYEKELIQ